MQNEKRRKYTSITVKDDLFQRIKEIADPRGMSAAEVVDDLVTYYERNPIPLRVDIKPAKAEFAWKWPGPYLQIITDPRVEDYKSTAWIRTRGYVDIIGPPQWGPEIRERLARDGEFKIEKIFIISPKVWEEKKVWAWIFDWHGVHFTYKERVQYFVVKEKDARTAGIDPEYYDMGIYGDKLVGFLKVNEKSEPEGYYTVSFPLSRIEEATDAFNKLKELKLPLQAYRERLLA